MTFDKIITRYNMRVGTLYVYINSPAQRGDVCLERKMSCRIRTLFSILYFSCARVYLLCRPLPILMRLSRRSHVEFVIDHTNYLYRYLFIYTGWLFWHWRLVNSKIIYFFQIFFLKNSINCIKLLFFHPYI